MSDWIFSFIITMVLVFLTSFILYQKRSLLSPSVIFGFWVSLSLLVCLMMLPDANYYPLAFLWYVFSILIFYMGEVIGSHLIYKPNKPNKPNKLQSNLRYLAKLTLVFSLLGCLSVLIVMVKNGVSFMSLFSIDELIVVARSESLARYEDAAYRIPTTALIATVFMYLGNLLGGFLYATSSQARYSAIAIIALLPNILIGLVLTTRAGLFLGLILWASAFLSAKVIMDHGRVNFLNKKKLFLVFFSSIATIGLLGLFRVLRSGDMGNFNLEYFQYITNKLFSIIYASIPAFNMWFEDIVNGKGYELTYGAITFGGFLSIFGVPRQKFESVYIGGWYPETTIHSIFGALSSDFSLFGSLIFLLFFGIVSGYIFKLARLGSSRAALLLTPIYAYLIGFLINSPWKFNNINLAIVVYILIVATMLRKGNSRV
jgi:oligosaccharide repeat unit polymerase